MATYEYIARAPDGQQVTGIMQADSEAAVARTLDERHLFPVRVAEQARRGRRGGGRRVGMRELSVLYSQLADLLRSGVPLLRSLEILIKSTNNPRQRQVISQVRDDVAAGKSLAEAMGQHPKVFTPLHSAMVRAGEQAGFLEEVLVNLSSFLERQDELRSKVRGALIYPLVLACIGSLVVVGILLVLVPRFKPLFAAMTSPTPTRLLFGASDLLTAHLHVLLAVIAVVVIVVRSYLRSPAGQDAWDRLKMKLPLLGTSIRMVAITRFCRILGTLLANGVPVLRAMEISRDATGSKVLSDAVVKATNAVREGQPLAGPLRACGLFPTQIVEMISVAEESNQLEKTLVQIADTVERRTNRQVDMAVRLMEPLILVLLAAVIGLVAVGLLYPIFTMAQTVRQ